MIHIKFDTKETTLFTAFTSPTPISSLAPLEVGDIQIYHKDHPDVPLVIIERKTIKDLAASIRDGRYKEQIIRLKSLHKHPTRIFFVIEGCQITPSKYIKRLVDLRYLATKINHMDGESLYSAFINIMVRDQISILESDDTNDTCQILRKLVEQVEKKYLEIIGQCVVTPHLQTVEAQNFHYSKTIKSNKKHNVNPQVCFINILSQIPGVSPNSAAFIIEQYPTMAELMQAYIKVEENARGKMLKEIVVKSDVGNGRKLGPIISNRVYQYLFGISEKEEVEEVVEDNK